MKYIKRIGYASLALILIRISMVLTVNFSPVVFSQYVESTNLNIHYSLLILYTLYTCYTMYKDSKFSLKTIFNHKHEIVMFSFLNLLLIRFSYSMTPNFLTGDYELFLKSTGLYAYYIIHIIVIIIAFIPIIYKLFFKYIYVNVKKIYKFLKENINKKHLS